MSYWLNKAFSSAYGADGWKSGAEFFYCPGAINIADTLSRTVANLPTDVDIIHEAKLRSFPPLASLGRHPYSLAPTEGIRECTE